MSYQGFTEEFVETFDNTDYSLAISLDINDIDPRILEIYTRFWNLGWLDNFGNQCFLMSDVLRKILRLHGIEAHTQEAIFDYTHPKKQWYQRIGAPMEFAHGGMIDTHRVVVTKNLILDWAHRDSIYRQCGAMSPRAFIGNRDSNKTEQVFDFFGRGKWTSKKNHVDSKNIVILQRDTVRQLVHEYFNTYRV